MFPQEIRLGGITPRNHSIDTTLSPTDLRHTLAELNGESPHKILFFDIIELGNNKESDISIVYEQLQVRNDQAKQETHKSIKQHPKMETPTNIPIFTPTRYHSPNSPHILCKNLIPASTLILSHQQQSLP